MHFLLRRWTTCALAALLDTSACSLVTSVDDLAGGEAAPVPVHDASQGPAISDADLRFREPATNPEVPARVGSTVGVSTPPDASVTEDVVAPASDGATLDSGELPGDRALEEDGFPMDSDAPRHCPDLRLDGTAADADCKGTCGPCLAGAPCASWLDCASRVCAAGTCAPATCEDGVKNGSETADDCGGSCPKCHAGQSCLSALDCESGVCNADVCRPATCTDEVQNAAETDTDCGGTGCPPCSKGKICHTDADCQSHWCQVGHCHG
jgi:hypothetical protein